jgi:hypothetical protein
MKNDFSDRNPDKKSISFPTIVVEGKIVDEHYKTEEAQEEQVEYLQ